MAEKKAVATEEQLKYAGILNWGMKIGMLLLIVTFAIYMIGILPNKVPVEDLPKYWGMSVKNYLKAADVHAGWAWVHLVGYGDFLNFVGIAMLAAVTVPCYLVIIPIYNRKGDKLYATLAVLEVLVLLLAASGIIGAGGH